MKNWDLYWYINFWKSNSLEVKTEYFFVLLFDFLCLIFVVCCCVSSSGPPLFDRWAPPLNWAPPLKISVTSPQIFHRFPSKFPSPLLKISKFPLKIFTFPSEFPSFPLKFPYFPSKFPSPPQNFHHSPQNFHHISKFPSPPSNFHHPLQISITTLKISIFLLKISITCVFKCNRGHWKHAPKYQEYFASQLVRVLAVYDWDTIDKLI